MTENYTAKKMNAFGIELCVEDFGFPMHREHIPEDAMQNAWELLEATLNDDRFACAGYRNNQAVNACIALHVLGIVDLWDWFEGLFAKLSDHYSQMNVNAFHEHVLRVEQYVDCWGPKGDEDRALDFVL